MRLGRLAIVVGIVAIADVLGGCGDRTPPPLGDHDAGDAATLGDVVIVPCSTPAPGCPCTQLGEQDICGTVYHTSGTYITCSKEYITCQEDGTWSACVGPTVLGAE